MLKKIFHVSVMTRNFEKTIDFYTKCLGFEVFMINEHGKHIPKYALLKLGNSLLEIDPINPTLYQNVGLNHMCLSTDNIHEEVHRLEKLGITFLIKPEEGETFAMFTGPDGVIIELVEKSD